MKVRIESDGVRTKVFDETGRNISGMVTAVEFAHHGSGSVPVAELELMLIEASLSGVDARMIGPNGKAVKKIVYADGTEEVFE